MEIAIGMVSAAITFLGLILAYIWRADGRFMRLLMDGLQQLMAGQGQLIEGQKEIARGMGDVAKMTQEILRKI